MNKPLILVVEDDTPIRNLITTTLKSNDYRYLSASNGKTAILEASSHNPDIVLLDLGLPDMDGVEVIQRRLSFMTAEMLSASSVTINGGLRVDYVGGCAYLENQELHLTPIEFKLLCLLSKNVGKVLTHTFITQHIWGRSWDNDVASLRVHMATLRKKLEPNADSPQYIQTHIGVGYRMMKVGALM